MEFTRNELQFMLDAAAMRAIEEVQGTRLISQREATAVYGREFVDAVRDGRLIPARIGNGKNGKRSYRVSDILAVRAYDTRQARLDIEKLRNI